MSIFSQPYQSGGGRASTFSSLIIPFFFLCRAQILSIHASLSLHICLHLERDVIVVIPFSLPQNRRDPHEIWRKVLFSVQPCPTPHYVSDRKAQHMKPKFQTMSRHLRLLCQDFN